MARLAPENTFQEAFHVFVRLLRSTFAVGSGDSFFVTWIIRPSRLLGFDVHNIPAACFCKMTISQRINLSKFRFLSEQRCVEYVMRLRILDIFNVLAGFR